MPCFALPLFNMFLCTHDEKSGGILIYRPSVRPSGYRYSFGATALIFCRMFIHIMEVCIVHKVLILFKYSQNDR
jgi:hypothetical protein